MQPHDEFRAGVALVTGAAQGIGLAVAAALAARGLQVAALDLRPAPAQPGLHSYVVDVSDAAAVEAAVQEIERSLGPIEYLANVAGILRTGAALELSDEDWLQTFAVNTHGVFYVSRAVGRRMRERRSGAIVSVVSNAAGNARTRMGAYAASKAAAAHFTRCLGLELAEYGIRCNLVSPGSTDTEMQRRFWRDGIGPEQVIAGSPESYRLGIPLRRIGQPEDVAAAVLFLLSDTARQITLQDIVVDGGATLGHN